MLLRALQFVATLGCAMSLSSCSSVSVKGRADLETGKPTVRPQMILVQPFTVNAAAVKEHPYHREKGQLAGQSQKLLAEFLRAEIDQLGIPAQILHGNPGRVREDVWIVSGTLTRVAEGNRLLRVSVGLGMGGTKMETDVAVRAGQNSAPFLTFSTSGGSGAMPGGITTPIPFTGAAAALFNSKDGVTADAARTARMISGSIADYAIRQGWLEPSKATRVKVAR